MSKITELKLQTKNKNRVNLYLDDEFFCGIELETLMKHNLKVGSEIEKEKLEKLQQESDSQVAFTKVLNLISKTMKTKKQLETYLQQKGYAINVVEYVIKKLEEYNYVNDELYASMYVKQESKKSGINKIKQQLFLKGVAKEIVEKVLSEPLIQENEIENLVNKYMKNREHTQKEFAKLYAYLMRRGFTYEQIKPFLKFGEEE